MTESQPPDFEHQVLIERVYELVARDRWDAARRLVAEGLRSNPDSPPLLFYSAYLDWRQDRNTEAAETLGKLLALEPDDYSGRKLLASLQEEQGRLADAELTWIALLREFPEDAGLYFGYGRLMLNTLHIDKARRLVAEGLRRDPHDHEGLFLGGLCDFVNGRRLDTTEHLTTLIRYHPESVQTGLALIAALQQRGRHREALRVAQQLLRSWPESAALLELVRSLKVTTHWTMLPLYPVQRWGWPFAIGAWFVIVFGLPIVAKGLPSDVPVTISLAWLAYCVYSWVWPRVLPRLI